MARYFGLKNTASSGLSLPRIMAAEIYARQAATATNSFEVKKSAHPVSFSAQALTAETKHAP